jgi:hypothetical protein
MRKGPCGREFRVWQSCVKAIKLEHEQRAASSLSSFSMTDEQRQKAEEAEYGTICFDYFRRLHVCIHANARNRAYYANLVKLRQDEEADELDDDEDDWQDEADDD